ncbi:GGDEF domain-containing protein [Alteromonas facilis]|uniref:GGDEF domain-containing protein n=1 Tax=Alteromonas facilis TaxID=2048004 RepID=UPI000C281CC0|nr:GGDEF domain-containing protein [Alteromonas facilis]
MLAAFQQACINYVNAGCSDRFDDDTNRRVVIVNLFAFIGSTITFLLFARAALAGDWPLAVSLVAASFLFVTTRTLQVVRPTRFYQLISSTVLQCCLMVLTLYLVITGGNNNTGPLWMYLVPPVCMFLGGFKRGLIANLGFTLCVSIVLFYPDNALLAANYSYEFKTRLLYSFATIIFLSALYEYSREQSFKAMRLLRDEFEQQALHDQLTKLPNRRNLNEQLKHEYQRTVRDGQAFTVLLADVDNFKQINDSFGHDTGDDVLCKISDYLRQAVRGQDLLARWGGEEFLLLLPMTNASNAKDVAEKIRHYIESHPISVNNAKLNVTISIGLAEVTPDTTIDEAINLADKRLYIAKQQGRNKVIWE